MQIINYRSSLDFILKLADADGDAIGWPTFNWRARFWTSASGSSIIAQCVDGECLNCFNDSGEIHIVLDDHGLPLGVLQVTFDVLLGDGNYADGDRRVAIPTPLDIKLIREAAPCPKRFEAELQLPAIKIKFSELTAEEKAEMMAPAVEAAGKVDDALAGVAGATGAAGEAADAANRAAGKAEGAAGAARTAADAAQGATGKAEGAADAANRAAGKANTATDEAIAAAAKANEAANGLIRDVGKVEAAIDKADAARDAATKAAMSAEEKAGLAETAATKATEAATESNNTNEAIAEAEARRVAAEEAREAAEDLRESAESLRAEAEANRTEAEVQRVAAEQSRNTEESERAKAETLRVASEKLRDEAESKRATAEQSRADDESLRAAEEAKRVKAEQLRAAAETERDEAEIEREAAEQQRETAEQKRATAEAERVETFAGFEGEIADARDYGLIQRAEAEGIVFNRETGYFELNGITDLTAEDTVKILNAGRSHRRFENSFYEKAEIRTNLPARNTATDGDFSGYFQNSNTVEVAACTLAKASPYMFTNCTSLHSVGVVGGLLWDLCSGSQTTFKNCPKLRELRGFIRSSGSIYLTDSPLLSIGSIKSWLTNVVDTPKVNVFVHPDVYAKLTDETNTEWHQLLIDATAKNISFATI